MNECIIPIPVPDPLATAWLEDNDAGNAERLVILAGSELRWVDNKFWVAFDGQRWSESDGEQRARRLALSVAQHVSREVAALGELIGDPASPDRAALAKRFGDWCTPERAADRLVRLSKHAVRSGDAGKTDGMLKQAKANEAFHARSCDFDSDPLAFNVENGTLFFRPAGDRHPVGAKVIRRVGEWVVLFREGHERGDMLRQLAGVAFDPDATCPQWTDRLVLLQPDEELRVAMPLIYGQSLTGLTDGEEFYTHQGQGRDGKSKTHEVLAAVFGDYYRHAGVKTWLAASFQKSGSEHRSDLVRLAGDVRFIVSEEPPKNCMWDSELMKQWTGGGFITARGANDKTEITYKPRAKIHVECNKLPAPPADDRGWWDRQYIAPWPVYVPGLPGGAEPGTAVVARLLTEGSGILNWLIDGCLAWLAVRKAPRPARVEAAVASAKSSQSPIAEFFASRCDFSDRSQKTYASVLYSAFKEWCAAQGNDKPPSQRRFGDELTDRQVYIEYDRKKLVMRVGVRLLGADDLLAGEGPDERGSPAEGSGMAPKAPARDPGGSDWPEQAPFDDLGDDPLGGWR